MKNSPPFTIEPVAEQTVKKFGFNKSRVAVEAPCGRSAKHPMENSPPFAGAGSTPLTNLSTKLSHLCFFSTPPPNLVLVAGLRLRSATKRDYQNYHLTKNHPSQSKPHPGGVLYFNKIRVLVKSPV
jgi:hypothetical protein